MAAVTYDLGDLVDKTIIAKSTVPIYKMANDNASPTGSVSAGQPVGVLYSWLNPDPTYNRKELWFMYYDAFDHVYYSKFGPGLYRLDDLIAQGVLSDAEKKAAADAANAPWYEQLLTKYIPVIGGLVLGAVPIKAVVGGIFSRKNISNNGN